MSCLKSYVTCVTMFVTMLFCGCSGSNTQSFEEATVPPAAFVEGEEFVLTALHGRPRQSWALAHRGNYVAGLRQAINGIQLPVANSDYHFVWYNGRDGGALVHVFAKREPSKAIRRAFGSEGTWEILEMVEDKGVD
jgi:hypothetical protein